MRLIIVSILVICGCFITMTVFAEFYRYTDEDGVLRFTDNPVEIPIEQWSEVQKYKDASDFLTSQEKERIKLIEAHEEREKEKEKAEREEAGLDDADDRIRDTVEPP